MPEFNPAQLAGQVLEIVAALRDDLEPIACRELTVAGQRYAVPSVVTGAQIDYFEDAFMRRITMESLADPEKGFEIIYAIEDPGEIFTYFRRLGLLDALSAIAITPDGARCWTPDLAVETEKLLSLHAKELAPSELRGVCSCFFVSERLLLRKLADWLYLARLMMAQSIAAIPPGLGGDGAPKTPPSAKPKRSGSKQTASTSPAGALPTDTGIVVN